MTMNRECSYGREGPVSRKPRRLIGSVKPFLVNRYLKTAVYKLETSNWKGISAQIKNLCIKQLCNHKV